MILPFLPSNTAEAIEVCDIMCGLNCSVKNESSCLQAVMVFSLQVTDVDTYLLSYFLHRAVAPPAPAACPFNSLCLICGSISSEPAVIPYHENKLEKWGPGCSVERSFCPTRMRPIAVGTHSLNLLVALLCRRKLASLPEEKGKVFFRLKH